MSKNVKNVEEIEEYCEKQLKGSIEIELQGMNESKEDEVEDEVEATDQEIDDSMNSFDSVNNPDTKKLQKKSKKNMQQIADDLVNAFLVDKSDKNWEALQNFFWYGIKHYAYKFVHVLDIAEDMAIDTFVNAHSKIDTFDPTKGRFSTWIFTCCRNNCLGYLKQKSKMDVIDNDISDIFDSELLSSSYSAGIDDFEYNFGKNSIDRVIYDDVAKQMYEVVLKEMSRFDGVASKIMTMKYINNMKIREIADLLNMNSSTVKNYLYRGRENLVNIIKINYSNLYQSFLDAKYDKNQAQYYV